MKVITPNKGKLIPISKLAGGKPFSFPEAEGIIYVKLVNGSFRNIHKFVNLNNSTIVTLEPSSLVYQREVELHVLN